MLGGPDGSVVDVVPGDALILPAGTGHCRITAARDFLVVGAYSAGQDWDICQEAPSESTRKRIANLPIPAHDPVIGNTGSW
ncbi:hypothetical protein [Sphingobium subterraneum]|uniref:Uncharacterized protein YjlB n=1 Tax=Sphingobium subterraneum TaxID=627688 RepID=A0A841J2D8_9SPHN|nr:hypothetical protein [Sphingobium subterraneum]MBB6124874.1 uncharacterized protein YjlB [Sphingobium subterraneum]